jgi:hypothetical protein
MRSVNWLSVLLVAAVVAAGLVAWQVIGAPDPEEEPVLIESAQPREIPLRRVPDAPAAPAPGEAPAPGSPEPKPTAPVSATSVVDLATQPAPTPADQGTPSPAGELLKVAWEELERLKALLKNNRSINEELIYALDVVAGYYTRPPPNDRRLILEADLAKVAREEGWPRDYLAQVQSYRRAVETTLRKALVLEKVHRSTERNMRSDINIRAALILGQTKNPALAKPLQNALERNILKAKHHVPEQLLDACFGSIASIGTQKSFEWMVKEFTHTKDSPTRQLDALVSAHRAMLRFEDVPGKSRHRATRQLVKMYAGSTDEQIWQRIGTGVIQLLQHLTGKPKDQDDVLLNTMEQFTNWFRKHKSSSNPVWADD